MYPPLRQLAALAAAALLPACAAEGEVRLDPRFPDVLALAPAAADIGQVTLVSYAPDQAPRSETRQLLDPGETTEPARSRSAGMTLAIELRAPNQRLLGYGRSGAGRHQRQRVVVVPMEVRKPCACLTGHTRLATFDTTQDATASTAYRSWVDMGRSPLVAAPTHDGGDVVVCQRPAPAPSWCCCRPRPTSRIPPPRSG
jgi:hypothetical protein